MQYTLRQSTAADSDALWQMLYYAAWMQLDGATSYQQAKTDAYLAAYVNGWGQATDVGVVAYRADHVLGAAWARPVPHPAGIANVPAGCSELAVAVHPSAQRMGLGNTLMHCLCALADAEGIPLALTVRQSNPVAPWYQRFGFEVVGTSINRVGSDSLIMQRKNSNA